MKGLVCIVLLFCLCVSTRNAISQTASPQQSEFQAAVANRIDSIALYLRKEADKGSLLASGLSRAAPQTIGDFLYHARIADTSIAKEISAPLTNSVASKKLGFTARALQKQIVVDEATSKSQAVNEYAQYLQKLGADIRLASPDKVSAILGATYVPPSVAIILSPDQITGGTVAAPDDLTPYVLGGSSTIDFPAVAAILYPDPGGGRSTQCTGSLIAANAVLTAAHCVVGLSPKEVYFQHAGLFDIKNISVNEGFSFPLADLAVIFLTTNVTGVLPVALNDQAAVKPGTSGTIVGYGWRTNPQLAASAGSGNNLIPKTGIKVYATATTNPCTGDQAGKNLVCWTYPGGELVQALGSTCFGDSGGPFAVTSQGAWKLAGVTSGGSTGAGACHPGDRAYDVEVYSYVGWIKSKLALQPAEPATTPFRSLQPMLNNQGSPYVVNVSDRLFDSSSPSWTKSFSVDQGAAVLRIAVNATPSGHTLALKATPGPCTQSDDDTAVFCNVSSDVQGNWTLVVNGAAGQEFQVVATEFSRP